MATSPVIDSFMKYGAPALSPAWETAVERSQPPAASPRVKQSASSFKTFFRRFAGYSDKPEIKGFAIERHFQFADVQRAANEAFDEYTKQASSWHHPLRTVGRSFTKNASATEVLLQFIPDGEYTFLICGALTLVYNAAKRIKKIREQILDCLSGLTKMVEHTELYMKLYSNQSLHKAAEDLYVTLLDAVQGIVAWLDESAHKRAFKAVFQQENYSAPLETKIKQLVEEKATNFHEIAEYCQHERMGEIHKGVRGGEDAIRALVAVVEGLAKDREWDRKKLNNDMENMQQTLYRLVDQPLTTFITLPQAFVNSKQVMELLQISPGTAASDAGAALRSGHALSPSRQARVATLMKNPLFQSWLATDLSMPLVVLGRDTESSHVIMSSLTYFAALFAQTVSGLQVALPIMFVCGKHATPGDELEGAPGMMRCLIFQLLVNYGDKLDLSFLNYEYLEALRTQDIHCLCHLFRSLMVSIVTSTGQGAIVCIVDGVSFLETDARSGDLQVVIQSLQTLMMDLNALHGFFVFKLILLYPTTSRYAREWFSPDSILSLPEDIPGDGHHYERMNMATASHAMFDR